MTDARYLCVVDLETTGLNPMRHDIIQIGRVVVDTVTRQIISPMSASWYVKPARWDDRDQKAMDVNKITKRVLDLQGISLYEALGNMTRGVDWTRSVMAAWGADFELKFLGSAYDRTHRIVPYPHQSYDVRSAAHHQRLIERYTEYLSLGGSCEYFNVAYDLEATHDALYDARVTAELAITLLQGDNR